MEPITDNRAGAPFPESAPIGLKYMAKSGFSIIVGKGIIFLMAFLFMAGLANRAGKDTVGTYSYVMSVLAIVSIATLPGMPSALIRAVARGKEGSLRALTGKRLLIGALGSVASALIGTWYLAHHQTQLGYAFLIAAPFVPLTDTMSDMAFAYWQGKKRFTKSTMVAIAYQALFSLPSLAVLFVTTNVLLIILSVLVFQSIAGCIVYQSIRPSNTEKDAESDTLGMHLSVMNVLRVVSKNVDMIASWHFFGPIFLATYTFAVTPNTKIEQLVPIEQIALPVLVHKEHSHAMRSAILKRMLALFLIEAPFFLALYVLAPLMYHVLFPSFAASVPLFRLLLLAPFCAPFLLPKTCFTAWDMRTQLYGIEVFSLVAKVACIIGFAIMYGGWGVALGVVISRVLESIAILALFLMHRTA